MKNKYREEYAMAEHEMEYRDKLVEELMHRTGTRIVNIIAYQEKQLIEPYTVNPTQVILEGRVANQTARMVISLDEITMRRQGDALFYGMREIVNRLMDTIIKAGANAL